MASFNARTDTGFSFSRLLSALSSQQGSHTLWAKPAINRGTWRKLFNSSMRACMRVRARRCPSGVSRPLPVLMKAGAEQRSLGL